MHALARRTAQAIQRGKFVASAVLCAIAAVLVLRFTAGGVSAAPASVDAKFGTIEEVAMELFARYSLSLEVVAVVLLVGILGAVVLAKRGE